VIYEVNAFGNRSGQLVATDPLEPGKAHIVLSLTPSTPAKGQMIAFSPRVPTPGVGQLSINGKPEGEAQFANVNLSFSETLDIGSDLGSPVSPEYKTPNRFTGDIDKVTIAIQ
jgi:arylsulfatase